MTCEICGGAGYLIIRDEEHDEKTIRICQCEIDAQARRRSERLLRDSGISKAQLERWQFGTFDVRAAVGTQQARKRLEEIVADLREFARHPSGWRILQGTYGVGKTHLAYAVAAHRARIGKPVYISNVPDLLDALRRGFDDDSYDERLTTLKTVDLLVLDDLGTENATPFAVEKLYQVIDARYRETLPMIVTTNRLLQEDRTVPGRIVSRLLDTQMSTVWTLPVGDYRRSHGRNTAG